MAASQLSVQDQVNLSPSRKASARTVSLMRMDHRSLSACTFFRCNPGVPRIAAPPAWEPVHACRGRSGRRQRRESPNESASLPRLNPPQAKGLDQGYNTPRNVYNSGVRTNIEIDEDVLREARQLVGTRTKRETVDLALRELVARHRRLGILDLKGRVHWEGDLEASRLGR